MGLANKPYWLPADESYVCYSRVPERLRPSGGRWRRGGFVRGRIRTAHQQPLTPEPGVPCCAKKQQRQLSALSSQLDSKTRSVDGSALNSKTRIGAARARCPRSQESAINGRTSNPGGCPGRPNSLPDGGGDRGFSVSFRTSP